MPFVSGSASRVETLVFLSFCLFVCHFSQGVHPRRSTVRICVDEFHNENFKIQSLPRLWTLRIKLWLVLTSLSVFHLVWVMHSLPRHVKTSYEGDFCSARLFHCKCTLVFKDSVCS